MSYFSPESGDTHMQSHSWAACTVELQVKDQGEITNKVWASLGSICRT